MTANAAALATGQRLHLGCGARFHPAWLNVDLQPLDPRVIRHDVTVPLPFADRQFEAVYHAHLLEHLPRDRVSPFLSECFRVLKPSGVLRVVVPNLEQIARLYLQSVDAAWEGDAEAGRGHRWAMLELYDQAVREQPGGAMLEYLTSAMDAPADLAWYRIGADGAVIRRHLERTVSPPAPRLGWRERLIRWLLGDEYDLLRVARFRRSGEVHRWMYDRCALRDLLTAAGLVGFRICGPAESGIADWSAFRLDALPDGAPAKPDSLYVEAHRP